MKHALIIAALLAGVATTAKADDIWTGEYWGDCGSKVQCYMEISNGGAKQIDVDFVVADRLDDKNVKCKLSGKFERTSVLMIQGNVKKVGQVAIGANPDSMSVMGIPKKACGVAFGGEFYAIGE
jgi:hypothetical protein